MSTASTAEVMYSVKPTATSGDPHLGLYLGENALQLQSGMSGSMESFPATSEPSTQTDHHRQSADDAAVTSLPVPVIAPAPSTEKRPTFEVLQRFEGTVSKVGPSSFQAVLRDRTNPDNPDEAVEFELDELAPGDRRLVEVGALFYWTIGYRDQPWGQRERSSVLKFRQIPAWTRSELKEVETLADEWAYMFEQDESVSE